MAALGDPRAGDTLDRMAHFQGVGLSVMIPGFAPDVIVVVGEVSRTWQRVGAIVNEVVRRRLPEPDASTHKFC